MAFAGAPMGTPKNPSSPLPPGKRPVAKDEARLQQEALLGGGTGTTVTASVVNGRTRHASRTPRVRERKRLMTFLTGRSERRTPPRADAPRSGRTGSWRGR